MARSNPPEIIMNGANVAPPLLIGAPKSFVTPTRHVYLENMSPDLGPLRLLWVVEVTTWLWGKGSLASPAATRPEMCAMSVIR